MQIFDSHELKNNFKRRNLCGSNQPISINKIFSQVGNPSDFVFLGAEDAGIPSLALAQNRLFGAQRSRPLSSTFLVSISVGKRNTRGLSRRDVSKPKGSRYITHTNIATFKYFILLSSDLIKSRFPC